MNRVSLVKSELINGDANERLFEMVTLEYGISRGEEKEGQGEEGPKQKLR